jgi:hypothetical protein
MKKRLLSFILLGTLLFATAAGMQANAGNYAGTTGWRSMPSSRNSVRTWKRSYRTPLPKESQPKEKKPIGADDWIFLILFAAVVVYRLFIYLLCGPSYMGQRKINWQDAPRRSTFAPSDLIPLPNHNDAVSLALCEEDPDFNTYDFLAWAKELFTKFQHAWMNRNWEMLRTFESDELYAKHEKELKELVRIGHIHIIDRININNAYFFLFHQEKLRESVAVFLNARMLNYIMDENTGEVLKGSDKEDCAFSYLYVFKRIRGMKTPQGTTQAEMIACPHCGAPLQVGNFGKCEYCNFVVQVTNHGWVLDNIIGVRPPYSTYGPGGVRKYEHNGGNTNGTYSSR